ncbi:hypothetical protein HDU83_003151 [Entophlyctis luteolus]|nr:hypothetical protein HDU83_003151 [Entophlyctis luteolus]KAJ3389025.1 hypothetical protein HDU84_009256 [Entophlyctis sp. JEL0112]
MSNFYDFLPEFEGLDKPQIFGMRDESEPALAATRIHDTLKPGLFRQRTSFGSTFGDSDSDRGTPIVPLRQGLLFGVQRQPGESAMLGDEEELLDDRRRGFAVPRVPLTRRGSRRATFTPFGSSPFGAGGSSGSESAVRRMSPARGMQGRAGVVSRTSVPVDADAEAEEADVDMEMD